MDNIKNKIITIVGKEEVATANKKNTTVKIVDQDGVRFVFWKKKADGTFSAVQEQFKNMGLDEGSTVKIGYVEDSYNDAKGAPRTSNKIINLQETNEQPVKLAQTQKSAPGQALTYKPEEQAKDESFWDKKAYKQCLWNYWLKGDNKTQLTPIEMDLVWIVFNQIEKDSEKRFAKGWNRAVAVYSADEPSMFDKNEPLPNEPVEVNVDPDSIPF